MTLMIYDKDGKKVKEFKDVKSHGLKTMYLGSPIRQVLMFNYGSGFNSSIDLTSGMTFALYGK